MKSFKVLKTTRISFQEVARTGVTLPPTSDTLSTQVTQRCNVIEKYELVLSVSRFDHYFGHRLNYRMLEVDGVKMGKRRPNGKGMFIDFSIFCSEKNQILSQNNKVSRFLSPMCDNWVDNSWTYLLSSAYYESF